MRGSGGGGGGGVIREQSKRLEVAIKNGTSEEI